MKKLFLIITLIALILVTASFVSAKSPKAAVVIHNDTCWVPDASGDFNELYEVQDCCVTVITNSQKNTKKTSCHAQLPEGADIPEKTMHLNYKNTGFECWWDMAGTITTQKYQFTLTPTGKVNFHCVWKD
jgi:hypothetical protein